MIARGAMWNASIFAQEPRLRPQREVFARYVALCRQYDNYFGNCKYVAMQMLEGHGKTESTPRCKGSRTPGQLPRGASDGRLAAAHALAPPPPPSPRGQRTAACRRLPTSPR